MIPVIDETFRDTCEEDLRIEEFDCTIKKIASDRSPRPDGITANFYKHFWEEIKIILFQAINECILKKELMTTMKKDLIKLIRKPGKDKRFLSNRRPITLLNRDCKIFTTVLAARLKEGILKIISTAQSGFLKGRSP